MEATDTLQTAQETLTDIQTLDVYKRQTYAEVPHKFEAGTVNAAGAYALGEAIRYIEGIGFDEITKREDELTALAMEEMKKNPYVHIIGSDLSLIHIYSLVLN